VDHWIFDGGVVQIPKKNIEHVLLVKKKTCRIVKEEKNIEQSQSGRGKGFLRDM